MGGGRLGRSFLAGLIALLIALLSGTAFALEVVEPTENFYVADYANVLSNTTENYIVTENDALYAQTGAQIVVVTVDFIGSNDIEDYAYELFNRHPAPFSDRQ